MTRRPKDAREALSGRPPPAGYEIGYAKPPKETRFKPGQSGNPQGRPNGSRKAKSRPSRYEERLKEIVCEEAYRRVQVIEGDQAVSIPLVQAIVRSMAVSAAKGNYRAARLMTEMVTAVETDARLQKERLFEAAVDYKVQWEREFERCRRLGLQPPNPVPHPDDVTLDPDTCSVHIAGPWTKDEKAVWDEILEEQKGAQAKVPPDPEKQI